VYVVILVFVCITVFFTYPETRGNTLEEIAIIFDGANTHLAPSSEILEAVIQHAGEKELEDRVEDVDAV
jgi:hypothetical protein